MILSILPLFHSFRMCMRRLLGHEQHHILPEICLLPLPPSLPLVGQGAREPVADRPPSPSRPPLRQAASRRASGPETGDPEMEEGWVENVLFHFVSVPKFPIKEQFPLCALLGPRDRVVGGQKPHHSHPSLLSPVSSIGQFKDTTKTSHTPSAKPWNQVSITPHHVRNTMVEGCDRVGPSSQYEDGCSLFP